MTGGLGEYALRVAREGLYLMLLVSAPVLLVSMVVGLVISVLQAATQVQDQTVAQVPKILAAFLALALFAPWIGAQLLRFTHTLFEAIPLIGR